MNPKEELESVVYPAMKRLLESLPQCRVGFGRNRVPVTSMGRNMELYMVATYDVDGVLGYQALEIEVKPFKGDGDRGQEYVLQVYESIVSRFEVLTFIGPAETLVPSNASEIKRAWAGAVKAIQRETRQASLRSRLIRLAHMNEALRPHLLPILTAGTPKKAGAPLQVGRTILSDNGGLRIHRYSSAVVVTDLTNAGKRGKKCMEARLWDIDMIRDDEVERDLEKLLGTLADSPTYQAAVYRIRGFITAAEMFGNVLGMTPKFDERELRGVDVTPAGFAPIVIKTPNFDLESDYNDFTVRSNTDKYNLPTCIPASKGGKEDIKAFYRWVSDNRAAIERMSYDEVMRGMDQAGIKSHQYCAMD